MHVYFIRHGETELGRKLIHQSPTTPLSERGREASYRLAERVRALNPDVIISSEYTRAVETARILGLALGRNIQLAGLFHEVVRPTSLMGKSHFSLRTLWYVALSALRRQDARWRYEDAENYADIVDRVLRAQTYLEALAKKHERVVIVSHSMYITIMISHLVHGRMLSVRDLMLTLLHAERMKNGDITHLMYDTKTRVWTLADSGA